jgi:VanZ family protein
MSKYLYLLNRNQFKVIFFITVIFVLYSALTPPSGNSHFFNFPNGDKVLHASAFFVLSFLLNRASSSIHRRIRNMLSLLGFGILIEFLQSFTSYRTVSFGVVVADLVGILLFQLTYSLLKEIQLKRHEKRERKNQ